MPEREFRERDGAVFRRPAGQPGGMTDVFHEGKRNGSPTPGTAPRPIRSPIPAVTRRAPAASDRAALPFPGPSLVLR